MRLTPEHCANISKGLEKKWQDPEFRERMIAIQRKNGLRGSYFTQGKRKYKAPTLEEYLASKV